MHRDDSWEVLKTRIPRGAHVSGTVTVRQPYGVWLECGLGYPTLLEVIQFEHAGARRYSLDDYPQIGEEVHARVSGFREDPRQIHLSQRLPGDPYPR